MAPRKPLGLGGWLVIVALLAMLVAAIAYAAQIWMSVDTHMSVWGWLFMILGVLVSVGLGAGLMALVFYSARHDYDR